MIYRFKDWLAPFLGVNGTDEQFYRDGFLALYALDYQGARVANCWMTAEKGTKVMKLNDLVVRPTWRGRGVVRLLLGGGMKLAKMLGMRKVVGYITQSDFQKSPWVAGWYENLGFELLPPVFSDYLGAVFRIEFEY